MTCFAATEYEIIPTETYKILRNCSGCGVKLKREIGSLEQKPIPLATFPA